MKHVIALLLASASVAAMATTAAAQPAQAPASAAADDTATLGEIVVTARRRSESLQEVPQSVTALSSETLQKFNIQRLEDITAVTPGLSLASGASGYTSAASLRGVTFQTETSAQPTVAFYLNDAPVESTVMFQSLFDVGQIEVLRGPQGTTRGISAPSGAITVTTRKPDLSAYGGYVDATVTDRRGRNLHGAVNVPIVEDVLGLRLSGLVDRTDFDGVRSLFNSQRPKQETEALRATLAYEPSERLQAQVTYQHLSRKLRAFVPVTGPGAGYNGPAIDAADRLSVNDGISDVHQIFDVVTAQVESRILGHRLSYVGSYAHQKMKIQENWDRGNLAPGLEVYNVTFTPQERTSHEIRLASDDAPDRRFDYTVGVFYQWIATDVFAWQPTALPGFFGSPFAPTTAAINPRYQALTSIVSPSRVEETSFFGSLTAHLGKDTELTVGGRQLIARNVRTTTLTLGPGFYALPPAAVGLPACGPLPSTYPGTCNFTLPSQPIGSPIRKQELRKPFIYNVSLSHHFSPDFLVYANTGSSWRYGPAVVGVFNANNDPTLTSLSLLRPETSRSYEIGFKSTFLDGRARLNVALYRQTFKNMIVRTEPVRYLSAQRPGPGTPALFNFTHQYDAKIDGFDIDAAVQITPEWNISAAMSYADGRAKDALIPCNGAIPAGQFIRMCPYDGSTSRDPKWSATVSSEYAREVRDGVTGFVRGLFTYYPQNSRRSPGSGFVVDSYGLMNLYAGLRSQDGAWEVSVFAKNALKTDKQLSLDAVPYSLSGAPLVSLLGAPTNITSGYFGTSYTPRREVGVNVRYSFGSR